MLMDFGFDLAGRKDPRLVRGTALAAVGGLLEAAPFFIAYLVLDAVFAGTVTMAWLPWVILSVLAVIAGATACNAYGGIDNFTASYGLVCDTRMNLIDHLRRLEMGFWNRERSGAISSLLTDQFNFYTEAATHVWSMVVGNLTKPVTLILIMLFVEPRLGLIPLISFALSLMSIPWAYRLMNRASDQLADQQKATNSRLVEFAQGVQTLREHDPKAEIRALLPEALEVLERQQLKTELAPAPAIFAYKAVTWAGFAVTFIVGALGVRAGWCSPSELFFVLLLSIPLYESMAILANYLALARFASRTLERIRAVFAEAEQAEPTTPKSPEGAAVRVEGVSFEYEDRPAVVEASAEFKPGTLTALVGPSGSGKSTLSKLIPRLWDVERGSIQVGGVDVKEMTLSELRGKVATVFQDVVLFAASVEDNIRLGRPEASREEVIKVAKAAEAHEFIEALPEGYDTVIGEGGADLSGGQRQRLSIARALLLDAPVLVLDEATSSVDSQHELQIQRAIGALTVGRTVIVIAHRLWTVQGADQILVLDKGRIVERGRHDSLLGEGGLYARMWNTQTTARGWSLKSAEAGEL